MVTIQVTDDFYPDPQQVRDFALEHDFSQGVEMDGHIYPGTVQPMKPGFTEWFRQLLSANVGRDVKINGTAFVSSLDGQFTEQWIHADSICAKWAAVVYLFDGHHQHGTALWRHRAADCNYQDQEFFDKLGVNVNDPAQVEKIVKRIAHEGEVEQYWQLSGFVEAKFNRLIIYPANHFHSRYPRHSFGDKPANARLVQVCFFDTP
jgi:hypothetical protein